MKPQATKATPEQLAYLAYWQALGYTFARDAVIPESTLIKPAQWYVPSWVDLAVSGLILVCLLALVNF